MESNDVYIMRNVYDNAYEAWLEKNKNVIHGQTVFIESLGLRYIQTLDSFGMRFSIEDKQKYFLAKIQYGL